MYTLRMGKRLIVVANDSLMDNHQMQLASAMRDAGMLQHVAVCCSVLQCVSACCRVLQRVAACCRVVQGVAVWP